ncbi:MAG: hypothetical protein ACR2NR_03040 [Solirubrobacteraceae bacterium]
MAGSLTVAQAVAAIVLCVAGATKLRAPRTAAEALSVPIGLIRAFSVYELVLGAIVLLTGARAAAALLGLTYVGLAALTLRLARRCAACGCFGEGDAPASIAQSALSAALALVAFAAAIGGSHGAGWILGRPLGSGVVLVLGIAASVYGTVVAYAELPLAWRAWSAP